MKITAGAKPAIANNTIVGNTRGLLDNWSATKFELLVTALEAGMLLKKHLPKIMLQTGGADESPPDGGSCRHSSRTDAWGW
jgi:hypothetical protein